VKAVAIAVFLLLLVLPWLLPAYGVQVAIQALILAGFAVSFNFLFRNAGLLSFGHAAFFGAGAYTAALLMSKWRWSYPATLPVVLAVTALVALMIGFLSVRLTKIYFTMLTLAFAQMLWAVVHRWYNFTGGDNGITNVRPVGVLGTAHGLYYLSLACLVFVIVLLRVVARSPAGYTLRAMRDNPMRVAAIGVSTFEYVLAAFVLSGTLSGLFGFLQLAWQRSAFPDLLYWTTSAQVIIAVILGGSGSGKWDYGPIAGAAVLVTAQSVVQSHTQYWALALGLVLLALVLFFPAGVAGIFSRAERRREQEEELGRAAA
jgi:branched-chain amino acid transport system permease protein